MASLRARINRLRRPVAGEAKSFVPHRELDDLLTRQEIKDAIESCDFVKLYNLEAVVDKVFSSAKRIFAILVVLNGQEGEILRFIESDNFQATPLDHKLPFARHDLQNIVSDIAIEFYEKQWEFAAPVLTKGVDHRMLNIRTALPFKENRKIGEGGFGEVFKITLHDGHQDITLISPRKESTLIRKQFPEILDDDNADYQRELRNLSLLNQLKHPNILELLASYTYQRKRNFIFPIARGGDLEALFKSDDRPPHLKTNYAFYCALANLSNAIEKIHDFTTEQNLELRLIGVHKDIKPSNILVDTDDFILADFGLSNFKNDSEHSHTPFRVGGGDFLAPECEDYDDNMRKGLVNRSSDIWSFGCVLAEVLTYMLCGKNGIFNFRNDRAIKVNNVFKVRTFYANNGQINGKVLVWLSELEKLCTPVHKHLLDLIRSTLVINKDERPKAKDITKRLRMVAINELLEETSKLYESMISSKVNARHWLHAYIESLKFQSWKMTYNSMVPSDSDDSKADLDLDKTIKFLKALHSELLLISVRSEIAENATFDELQNLNDKLFKLFPNDIQTIAYSHQQLELLDDKTYRNGDFTQILSPSAPIRSDTRFLLFMKSMLASADKKSNEVESERLKQGKAALLLRENQVKIDDHYLGDHQLGWKSNDTLGIERRVLIEWIVYDTHWSGAVMDEMVTRVVNTANFLNEIAADADKTFGLLHCSGYVHSIHRHSFGLVFDFPGSKLDAIPKTLNALILESRGTVDAPLLGARFALACNICSILINLHKATLFHKNVSSRNMILFPTNIADLSSLYLIGFNYSRPNDPTAFSEGPQSSATTRKYQDPRYAQFKRFQLEFDYYSVGLVLLEIGIWDTVENMTKKASSLEQLREILITKRVPILGHVVGKIYRDAVLACLTGDFSGADNEPPSITKILQFERRVLLPLSQLTA